MGQNDITHMKVINRLQGLTVPFAYYKGKHTVPFGP